MSLVLPTLLARTGTRIFTPGLVNALRYGFQQSKLAFDGGDYPTCTITSIANCPSSVTLRGALQHSALVQARPGAHRKGRQAQDNATWSRGRHTITFGGEFDYQNSPNVFLPNQNGAFAFADFNHFLQGHGSSI